MADATPLPRKRRRPDRPAFDKQVAVRSGGTVIFSPTQFAGLSLWLPRGRAIGASWLDSSGFGRNLAFTGSPTLNVDGSVTFSGTGQYGVSTFGATLAQPLTVFLLMKQISFVNTNRIFDGLVFPEAYAFQDTVTPSISSSADSVGTLKLTVSNITTGNWFTLTSVFNGASGLAQEDLNSALTGNVSTNSMTGFTLAAAGGGLIPSNIQVAEVLIYNSAFTTTQITTVVQYLTGKQGGLT